MSDGEFYPCDWCGSTGECEHLAAVLHIEGNRPIPVRARGGLAEAQERAAQAIVGMWRRTQEAAAAAAGSDAGEVLAGWAPLLVVMFLALIAFLLAVGMRPQWGWWQAFAR